MNALRRFVAVFSGHPVVRFCASNVEQRIRHDMQCVFMNTAFILRNDLLYGGRVIFVRFVLRRAVTHRKLDLYTCGQKKRTDENS